jgi:aspartate/methionine/tyrosine aminotransferase
MSNGRSTARSPYMEFAKLNSKAKYNLATSGLMSCPLAELPVQPAGLEINGADSYGYAPLLERIARYNGVPAECVVTAAGTSMANYLAMAACFEPGDDVLIEAPAYELLVSTARYLGARVNSFPRRFEDGYAVDPAEVRRAMTPRTRLIVLTTLHNPSGAILDEPTLRAVGDIAAEAGARVLVDEVYLEMLFDRRPRPAFHLGRQFLVTSSLTKAFGLGGLRCGWVLAEAELAQRMWHIADLHAGINVYLAELLSVTAFDQLDRVAARARQVLESNRPRLHALLDAQRRAIEVYRPEHGTIVFPRLQRGTANEFFRLLRDKYETSVVPGEYFGEPRHFRLGIGGDPEMTAAGLERIAEALEEYDRQA